MEKIVWSKSRLGIFSNCPYSYQLKYIDKVPQAEVEALSKGVKLHKIFDNYYEFMDITKAISKEQITTEFVHKYEEHINNFLNFNSIYKLIPHIREKQYTIGNITGVVDRIDIIDGKYAIIDYKSSSGNSLENYYKELLLYAYLIQEALKLKIDKVGVFFTTNNKFIVEDITQDQITNNLTEIKEEISLYEDMINKKQFPKTYNNCHWCGYREQCQKK